MKKTRILLMAGMFGMSSSRLLDYVKPMSGLAAEFGADCVSQDWNSNTGLERYSGVDQVIAVPHSFGVNRFLLDTIELADNMEVDLHAFTIDGVRFTLDDHPVNYVSSAHAQLSRTPMIFGANVAEVRCVRRRLTLPETIADWLDLPIAINSPVGGGQVSTDEQLDVPGIDAHNDIVSLQLPRVLSWTRGILEAA